MFMGFIPVLVALAAGLVSFRDPARARWLWFAVAGLVAAWGIFHGSHHYDDLSTYGAW